MPRQIIIPIGPSIAYVPLTRGQFSLIDVEDVAMLSGVSWSAQWKPRVSTFYATNSGAGFRRMHRVIADSPAGVLTDHVNGNTLDNRRVNLRWATPHENSTNRKVRNDSASGRKGVRARRGGWRAQIMVDKRAIHLGDYDTIEQASAAYSVAALEHFGEFSKA